MPEGAGVRTARVGRYPPLASLVVSTIAAFSAVIVIAVLHSVCLSPCSCVSWSRVESNCLFSTWIDRPTNSAYLSFCKFAFLRIVDSSAFAR